MRIAKYDRFDMLNNPGSDGPAFTIWFSGCTAKCPGCHNAGLWSRSHGSDYGIHDIMSMVMNDDIQREYDDIVLLGGEPLEQDLYELMDLVGILVLYGFRIWLYTGWEYEDVPGFFKNNCHFIKTGRYMAELKCDGFPASRNQRVFIRVDDKLEERRKV